MLICVSDFKRRTSFDLDALVTELQHITGRVGIDEAQAWRSSLPALAQLLSAESLNPLHIFFGGAGHLSLEYQLPAASAWCDAILLGAKEERPSALIVELKHWDTGGDRPGHFEGQVIRGGSRELHPSRQVGNYTEYVRRFHSEILSRDALVNGCVFFTRSGSADAYREVPNQLIAANFPIFTTHTCDVENRFPHFVSGLLTKPAPEFANAFERGSYKQERSFVKQIGEQILNPSSSPFVLLDKQDQAFLECRERVREVVDRRSVDRKHVVVVHGPPGSGKSVVAARLWAALVTDGATRDGNIVVTTTSTSQNSNWVLMVEKATRMLSARGVIKKANDYPPATLNLVRELDRKYGAKVFKGPEAWRDNLKLLRTLVPRFRPGARDDEYLVSIVDEAHALINPEHAEGRAGPLGFVVALGPQAYHIIRASRLTVMFMDSDQSFRDRENTRVEDLRKWANELGATFDEIDLAGAQFRCAGSKEYVDWIQIIRSNTHPQIAARHARRWRISAQPHLKSVVGVAEPFRTPYLAKTGMSCEIVRTPGEMEGSLRRHLREGFSARVLSSFSRTWKTKGVESPHALPPELLDFNIPYTDADGSLRIWARPWNVTIKNDYTRFVQAVPGSAMAEDQLAEVGCPYAVRGFDFDYVGIIWARDLIWRRDRWVVDPIHVRETGNLAAIRRAKKEVGGHGPAHEELLQRVWQAYRILLTRAMRGIVVYVEDEETRVYLTTASGSS